MVRGHLEVVHRNPIASRLALGRPVVVEQSRRLYVSWLGGGVVGCCGSFGGHPAVDFVPSKLLHGPLSEAR